MIEVEQPIIHAHNYRATERAIQALLRDGTPRWVSHPWEYRNFVREEFQREKEKSDAQVQSYRWHDQEALTDKKARLVNILHAREFMRRLHNNGVQCFTHYAGMPDTAGLWAVVPGYERLGHLYICYIQVPYMAEWSVLRLDAHKLPSGEEYRGWRTALCRLIEEGVLSESKAHEIFGEPTSGPVSLRYRRSLYYARNFARPRGEQNVQ